MKMCSILSVNKNVALRDSLYVAVPSRKRTLFRLVFQSLSAFET